MVRQLHNLRGRFRSVVDLCAKLIEELMDQVPDSMTFSSVILKEHITQKSG